MICRSFFALLGLLAITPACATGTAQARTRAPNPKGDPVMKAMSAELDRSMGKLRLEGYDAPYYMAYAVKETRKRGVAGKHGSVYTRTRDHKRMTYVDVRVGSYDFDSSEDQELGWIEEGLYEPSVLAPLEGTRGLRHTLWMLSDLRYKQALSSYLKMKGQRVYEPEEQQRPSFSKAPAVTREDPRLELTFDDKRWAALVRTLGAELAKDAEIFDAEVQVEAQVETRWFINSEGARVRTEHPMYAVYVNAWTQAPDGALIDLTWQEYAPAEKLLPHDDAMVGRTRKLMKDLAALRAAPQLEPYTGPAILEPAASGVFFHEVLGHRLEGHRQHKDDEGQTFASHLGKKILPEFISVADDPTLRESGDVQLNGYYTVDDEGVASQRVMLVERGVLKNFLLPRRPVKGFSKSNGHGRAQGVLRPVGRMGNTIVIAHQTVSRAELKKRLIAEVKRQGKPFGLIVRDITGGATNTSSYGFQAFKGEARMVYKVDPDTGEETLVRGVEIVGTPLVSISKLVAAADDVGVFNGYCGAESGMVPVSTVAPSTLFSEIELQRTARKKTKRPILDLPEEVRLRHGSSLR